MESESICLEEWILFCCFLLNSYFELVKQTFRPPKLMLWVAINCCTDTKWKLCCRLEQKMSGLLELHVVAFLLRYIVGARAKSWKAHWLLAPTCNSYFNYSFRRSHTQTWYHIAPHIIFYLKINAAVIGHKVIYWLQIELIVMAETHLRTHTHIPQADPDMFFFLLIWVIRMGCQSLGKPVWSWQRQSRKTTRGFHTTVAMISFNRLIAYITAAARSAEI